MKYMNLTIDQLHDLLVNKEVTPLDLAKEAIELAKKDTITNEVVFHHKGNGLTANPAGYIFLCYEVIDDIHLYKDTYNEEYFNNSSKN